MKHLNNSLSCMVLALACFGLFVLSDNSWVHAWQGDVILCLASCLIMLCAPYYVNILEQATKWQKFFIGLALFVFSAELLYYNLYLWIMFLIFFLLLYGFLWPIKDLDVGVEEMPYQYFFRKKQYLKRTILVILPFVLVYWAVISCHVHNIIEIIEW